MNKKISVGVALSITLIAMTVTLAITVIVAMNIFDNAVSSVMEKQNVFNKIAEIDNYVRNNYYGEIEDELLYDQLRRGYMDGVGDKNGRFYTKDEYLEVQDIASGKLVGIGVEIIKETGATGRFRVVRVYPGSPAEAEGIEENALIISVNGIETKNVTSVKALQSLLRGEQGTELELVCLYDSKGAEEFSYHLQRENFQPPTVESIIEEGYAYIRITSFGPHTYSEFEYAVLKAVAENVKGFVFDVRNNKGSQIPGTEYNQVFDMIDLLCPTGTIARAGYKSNVTKVLATSDENGIDLPMVVLVNENTAEMAELFAISIRNLSNGQLLGSKTAGKGTLQKPPHRMSDGSAVCVTYALLLTGKEIGEGVYESFDGVGILPDVEVPSNIEEDTTLYKPNITYDMQIVQGIALVKTMARASGLETDSPELVSMPPDQTSEQSSSAGASSLSEDNSEEQEDASSKSDSQTQGASSG